MAKLQIRKMGDDVLRKTCRPVDGITPRILTLLDDMTETMRAANGCGLAGPQVGVLRRVAVVEGVPALSGAAVHCTDLRGGAALVVAALAADGVTAIHQLSHLDRGYDSLEQTLTILGADIRRVG